MAASCSSLLGLYLPRAVIRSSSGTLAGEPTPHCLSSGWALITCVPRKSTVPRSSSTCGVKRDRLKALAAIFVGDHRPVGLRHGTEKAGRGVADSVELAGSRHRSGRRSIRRCNRMSRTSSCRRGRRRTLRGSRAALRAARVHPAPRRRSSARSQTRIDWVPLISPKEAEIFDPSGEMSRSNGVSPYLNVWIWLKPA